MSEREDTKEGNQTGKHALVHSEDSMEGTYHSISTTLGGGGGGMIPFPATCMIENFPELLPLAKPEKIFPQALYSNLRVFL